VPDITIPKLNTLDTTYVLVEWLFAEGAAVPADSAVAVVETSKAAEELVCAEGGILHRMAEPPAEFPVGTVIGRLFLDDAERLAACEPAPAGAPSATDSALADRSGPPAWSGEFIVTKAARDLIGGHGITEDDLRALDKKIIRSGDVEALIALNRSGVAEQTEAGALQPSRSQQAVAEAVSLSHHTIPAAYCVIKVEVDAALQFLRELSWRSQELIGLPELLVKCIAVLHAEFPMCYARRRDDGATVPSETARVGVTVDVGTGLSVPVIPDAGRKSLREIGRTLADFRMRALRRRLHETDLAGGNIALALNDDDGIVAAQPLILPPLVCMLSLCSVQQELRLQDTGQVDVCHYFNLGLAYDHRLINGREAALFLRAVRTIVVSPDRLDRLAQEEAIRP
jgi:2-oxoglutarate dehydrogenase E2 component (dihydrolipoamide succinyltransferase)